jgi:hypothetical protein
MLNMIRIEYEPLVDFELGRERTKIERTPTAPQLVAIGGRARDSKHSGFNFV